MSLECGTEGEDLQSQVDSLKEELIYILDENKGLKRELDRLKHGVGEGKQNNRKAEQLAEELAKETPLWGIEAELDGIRKELKSLYSERQNMAMQRLALCQAMKENKSQIMAEQTEKLARLPSGDIEKQLRDLRSHCQRLQNELTSKADEGLMLKVELESKRKDLTIATDKLKLVEERANDLHERLQSLEKGKIRSEAEHKTEVERQLACHKQRLRAALDELEDMRTANNDLILQVDDYRAKYLSAQEMVEELRQDLDRSNMECSRISEQTHMELSKAKIQYQEKLKELGPLHEILKTTQLKLQESQQLRVLAEKNCEQMCRDMDQLKLEKDALMQRLDEMQAVLNKEENDNNELHNSLNEMDARFGEVSNENVRLKAVIVRMEEVAIQNERRFEEKSQETQSLLSQLELLREDSSRQVNRTKDRCESIRRSMTLQISDLERQLAASRASARAAIKDRDEIRSKLQVKLTKLTENFEEAQSRIKVLQSHIKCLRRSYTSMMAPDMSIVQTSGQEMEA